MTSYPQSFWNLSNHSLDTSWSEPQKEAARAWAGPQHRLLLREAPFPNIDPEADTEAVEVLVEEQLATLGALGCQAGDPILVQGEFSFVVGIVPRLKQMGLIPLCATSRRLGKEALQSDGSVLKSYIFEFVRFRNYP